MIYWCHMLAYMHKYIKMKIKSFSSCLPLDSLYALRQVGMENSGTFFPKYCKHMAAYKLWLKGEEEEIWKNYVPKIKMCVFSCEIMSHLV